MDSANKIKGGKMAGVINFGSLNLDHVHRVPHIVRPGETITGSSYETHCGGKGLNQSVALAKAGAKVAHAGKTGPDGEILRKTLADAGVSVDFVFKGSGPSGQAIIQVADSGENSIVLFPGANRAITDAELKTAMKSAAAGDILLLQNETNAAAEAIELGFRAGMRVCLNPAPFDENIKKLPLEKLSFLILNETEAEGLAGTSGDPAYLTGLIASRHPKTAVVMTLGSKGVIMMSGGKTLSHPGYKVKAVDTTAAGDTFIGFFLAVKLRGGDDGEALATACRAASICVTRRGAAGSIPSMAELSAAQT